MGSSASATHYDNGYQDQWASIGSNSKRRLDKQLLCWLASRCFYSVSLGVPHQNKFDSSCVQQSKLRVLHWTATQDHSFNMYSGLFNKRGQRVQYKRPIDTIMQLLDGNKSTWPLCPPWNMCFALLPRFRLLNFALLHSHPAALPCHASLCCPAALHIVLG